MWLLSIFLLALAILLKYFLNPYFEYQKSIKQSKEVKLYINGKLQDKISRPYLLEDQNPEYDLTIIVPSYNEEKRLPVMMKNLIPWLLKNKSKIGKIEILIVNDGSTDSTFDVALEYTKEHFEKDDITVKLLANV